MTQFEHGTYTVRRAFFVFLLMFSNVALAQSNPPPVYEDSIHSGLMTINSLSLYKSINPLEAINGPAIAGNKLWVRSSITYNGIFTNDSVAGDVAVVFRGPNFYKCLGSFSLESFRNERTKNLELAFTVPANIAPGNYQLYINAEPYSCGFYGDTYLYSNIASLPIMVIAPFDISVESVSIDDAEIVDGVPLIEPSRPYKVNVTIKGNSFDSPETRITGLRLNLSSGVSWDQVIPLADFSNGQPRTFHFTITISPFVPSGTYKLSGYFYQIGSPIVEVNYTNDFKEIDVRLGIPTIEFTPVDTEKSCSIPTHSSVDTSSLSLSEQVPLVGVPFYLSYSSERFRSGFPFASKVYGLGGWQPSILHRYHVANKTLYLGNGGIRKIQAQSINGGYYATDSSGTEIYYFNSLGLHTETKNTLTGITKYVINYYSDGRLASIVDTFGNTTLFQHESGLIVMTSPYGQQISLRLDGNGFLSSVTNLNNESYLLTHTSQGYLTSFQKPAGQKSFVTYDQKGYVTRDTGAGGDFISFLRQFNSNTRELKVTSSSALGKETFYSTWSNANGNVQRQSTASFGGISNYSSVSNDKDISTDFHGNYSENIQASDPRFGWMAPYNKSSSYAIQSANINANATTTRTVVLANSSDPLSIVSLSEETILQNNPNRKFKTAYDADSKLLTSISPLNRVTYQRLNSLGQTSAVQIGGLTPTNIIYDNRGRISQLQQGTRNTSLTYNNHGNVDSITNAIGQTTRFIFDNAGRMTKKILQDGKEVNFTFDPNGNVTSITPPSKKAHMFSYNLFELMGSYLPPSLNSQLSGATVYEYNLDQELTAVNRPDGTQITYTYNPASGLLQDINTQQGNYSFTYKQNSNLITSVVAGSETLNYSYFGNILREVNTSGSITSSIQFSYRNDGLIFSLIASGKSGSSHSISLDYDNDDLLTRAGSLSLTRNNTGAISQLNHGKISENISYDQFGQTSASISRLNNKNHLFSQSYSRDRLGRVVSIVEGSGWRKEGVAFDYDQLGRLVKAKEKFGSPREYQYDANGNRVRALTNRGMVKAEYDDQDRLIKYGRTEYQYNENGELIAKVDDRLDLRDLFWWLRHGKRNKEKVTTYSYDAFGNLKSVSLPDKRRIDYILDGQNRRIGKKINGKLVQGLVYQNQTQIAAELDGNGNIVKRFIYASKVNIPDYMIYQGREYRIISDQVGSPRVIAEVISGKILESLDFDEFGVIQDKDHSEALPFGFAGGLYDEDTKLTLFGARNYDAQVGRWLSKDPILFEGGDTNLYGYVMNDPVNWVDPSGLARCTYSLSTGRLSCSSNDGSKTIGLNGISGGPGGGPIPAGRYDIRRAPGQSGGNWFLDPGLLSRIGYRMGINRGGFNLHLPGRVSEGCISVPTKNNPRNDIPDLNDLLTNEAGSNVLDVIQ